MSNDPYARPGWFRVGVVGPLVALLLVVGALTATLVQNLNKDEERKAAERTSESSGPDPESRPHRNAPDGETVVGRGYTYALPHGWTDQTRALRRTEGASATTDTGVVWGRSLDDLRANVLTQLGETTDEADLESLRSAWEANLSQYDQDRSEVPTTTIGGREAIGVRMERTNARGKRVASTAYLVVADGQSYTIVLSTPPSYEDDARAAFAKMLDTWAWA